MTRSRAPWILALVVTLVTVAAVPAVQATVSSDVSAAQLKSGFKKATGQKLVVDRTRTSSGQYTAYNLGVQTRTKQARYGEFTIYLVTADVAANVENLLKDVHTSELGTPTSGGIYWEHDSSLGGGLVWTAKHRYGSNIVLQWTTTQDVKKTDRTFTTLHKALTAIVRKAGH